MKNRKQLSILVMLLFTLGTMALTSCHPRTGAGSAPKTIPIDFENPLWATYVGPANNYNTNNYTDIKVKIMVQTLDANQNATLYKNYSFSYSPTFGNSPVAYRENIQVPSSGQFVVQVTVTAQECTYQGDCTYPNPEKPEYFKQLTFTSAPSSFFFSNFSKIDFDCC